MDTHKKIKKQINDITTLLEVDYNIAGVNYKIAFYICINEYSKTEN